MPLGKIRAVLVLTVLTALFVFPLNLFPLNQGGAAEEPAPGPFVSEGSTRVYLSSGRGAFAWWSGEALLAVENRDFAPVIRVIDREGREISRIPLEIPNARGIRVLNNALARGPDGMIAVIGHADFNDYLGSNFLALLSPDGQRETVVRLSPFNPDAVTVAADGTIWLAGHEFTPAGKWNKNSDLIRRYDRAGKLVGSFVNWSNLNPPVNFPSPDSLSVLVSSPDRVGWYSKFGRTYIEFSLEGNVMYRVNTPAHERSEMLQPALCEDGRLFVSAAVNNNPSRKIKARWGIYVLDRERGEWNYIPREGRYGRAYGCDRTRLATTTEHGFITWLRPAK